jgi:hypothetical protein
VGVVTILGLLYADYLAVEFFTVNGKQKVISQITKYCEDWSLNAV